VCGAAATTIKTYYEVKSAKKSAVEADKNSEASYETLAPAVLELQNMSEEEQLWANEMNDYTQSLENRVIRLEAYIEVLSLRQGMPSPVPAAAAAVSAAKHHSGSKPEPSPLAMLEPDVRKAARLIPVSLDKAKAFQQQRAKEKCSPTDPLCGKPFE